MNRIQAIKAINKVSSLQKSGNFFIGNCNEEIISGYSIDAQPSNTYIWRFILPCYDCNQFLHLSLSKRIIHYPKIPSHQGEQIQELTDFIIEDWRSFSEIDNSVKLSSYLDREEISGDYCEWVKYITLIWRRQFNEAEKLLDELQSEPTFPRVGLVADNLKSLSEVIVNAGWEGAASLLMEWSNKTVANFCSVRT